MKLTLSGRKKVVIYIVIALCLKLDLHAQDPHFSQFYANAIYTNPAFAGSTHHGRFISNARNQWSRISGTFTTLSAAYDEHYDIINGGIGLIVTRDQAGVGLLTTNSISGMYSYQIPINKYVTVRAAIQGSLIQKTLEFGNYTWGDQIMKRSGIVKPVTGESPANPSIFIPNVSAGAVVYTKIFYGGFALHNITEPNQSFWNSYTVKNPIHRRITAHSGIQIQINKAKNAKNAQMISPNILFMQQGPFTELDLGMYYNRGPYIIGGYYRQTSENPDAFIVLLGLRREKLRIGYSYDATLSNARPGAPASHEISVAFELRKRTPKTRVRVIRCPEF